MRTFLTNHIRTFTLLAFANKYQLIAAFTLHFFIEVLKIAFF